MKILKPALIGLTLLLSACGPSAVQVFRPVPASVRGAGMIADVRVRPGPMSRSIMAALDQRTAERRSGAGLPPVDPAAEPPGALPRDQYDMLPFAQMFELMLKDVARERGLAGTMALRVEVEIDTLKTANAGMAIIAGSRDQLAGQVEIFDARSNERIGQYYVDVVNAHSGLIGLAIRGGGIREKLAAQFARHIVDQLTVKR
jgi:hypothetical protein